MLPTMEADLPLTGRKRKGRFLGHRVAHFGDAGSRAVAFAEAARKLLRWGGSLGPQKFGPTYVTSCEPTP